MRRRAAQYRTRLTSGSGTSNPQPSPVLPRGRFRSPARSWPPPPGLALRTGAGIDRAAWFEQLVARHSRVLVVECTSARSAIVVAFPVDERSSQHVQSPSVAGRKGPIGIADDIGRRAWPLGRSHGLEARPRGKGRTDSRHCRSPSESIFTRMQGRWIRYGRAVGGRHFRSGLGGGRAWAPRALAIRPRSWTGRPCPRRTRGLTMEGQLVPEVRSRGVGAGCIPR